jgi:hypothetical protein
MGRLCSIATLAGFSLLFVPSGAMADDASVGLAPIVIDRELALLPNGNPAFALAVAGKELGDWKIALGGVEITGSTLIELAAPPDGEPLLRYVREKLRRAVDLEDFIFWLDDVLVAGQEGRRGEAFVVGAGRGRAAGILVHPDDIFKAAPRRYAAKSDTLDVDTARAPEAYRPALDGEPLGPRWTARYPNPATRKELLDVVTQKRSSADLTTRVQSLVDQIEEQGAEVWLTSTVRPRERGYLMWGAYYLSRTEPADQLAAVLKLKGLNEEWGLRIPIAWAHPDGVAATKEAARKMADAYRVVYATERGAKNSSHYTGVAVDFVAIGIPRKLTLRAPSDAVRTFDLSNPDNTRDLSLEPELIAWVEKHFAMKKLSSDYPHWTDTK